MEKLYAARDGMEAHFLRQVLEEHGIPAQVLGENLGAARGDLPLTAETLPAVWVARENVQAALTVVRQFTSEQGAERGEPWTCPVCGAQGEMSCCWRCGSTRDGQVDPDFEPAVVPTTADPACRRCGYSLRGLDSDRCPECGCPFDRDAADTPPGPVPDATDPRVRRRRIALHIALCSWAALLVVPPLLSIIRPQGPYWDAMGGLLIAVVLIAALVSPVLYLVWKE